MESELEGILKHYYDLIFESELVACNRNTLANSG